MVNNNDMGFYTSIILATLYELNGQHGRANVFTGLALFLLMCSVYRAFKGEQ